MLGRDWHGFLDSSIVFAGSGIAFERLLRLLGSFAEAQTVNTKNKIHGDMFRRKQFIRFSICHNALKPVMPNKNTRILQIHVQWAL